MNTSIGPSLRWLMLAAGIGCIFPDAMAQGGVIGIKGGLNLSTLNGGNVLDPAVRTGYHLGAFLSPQLTDGLSLNVELLYSTKGADDLQSTADGSTASQSLNYLEAPLFLGIHLGKLLELHAGGYAEYLLTSQVRSAGDLSDAFEELDENDYQGLGFGLLGGAAVNLGSFQIGARYNYGLTKVAGSGDAQLFLGDARNAVTQVYLALGLF